MYDLNKFSLNVATLLEQRDWHICQTVIIDNVLKEYYSSTTAVDEEGDVISYADYAERYK